MAWHYKRPNAGRPWWSLILNLIGDIIVVFLVLVVVVMSAAIIISACYTPR